MISSRLLPGDVAALSRRVAAPGPDPAISGRKAGAGRILFFDPIHFVMERKMMLGIKARAEAYGAERKLRAA